VLLAGLEIPVETAIRALSRGVESKMLTVLNPAPVPSLPEAVATRLLAAATVITPNRVEAMALAGMALDGSTEPDCTLCADRLIEMGPAAVVITLGSQGCLVRTADGSWPFAAPRVEAVDTVGAGDAFNGALAVAAVERANASRRRPLGKRRRGAGRNSAGGAVGFAASRGDRQAGRKCRCPLI